MPPSCLGDLAAGGEGVFFSSAVSSSRTEPAVELVSEWEWEWARACFFSSDAVATSASVSVSTSAGCCCCCACSCGFWPSLSSAAAMVGGLAGVQCSCVPGDGVLVGAC